MPQLITWFLNYVMNGEVTQKTGITRYAKSSTRKARSPEIPLFKFWNLSVFLLIMAASLFDIAGLVPRVRYF